MKKVVLALVAAGSALAFPRPPPLSIIPHRRRTARPTETLMATRTIGARVRSLQVRINNVQRQIKQLDRRDCIRDGQADRLRREANQLENRLQRATRYGLNGYEANDINVRVARLEQRVQYSLANRYGNRAYAYSDRDRDGRNDRYEDDRGYRHD